jgi:hypothetical protein
VLDYALGDLKAGQDHRGDLRLCLHPSVDVAVKGSNVAGGPAPAPEPGIRLEVVSMLTWRPQWLCSCSGPGCSAA